MIMRRIENATLKKIKRGFIGKDTREKASEISRFFSHATGGDVWTECIALSLFFFLVAAAINKRCALQSVD